MSLGQCEFDGMMEIMCIESAQHGRGPAWYFDDASYPNGILRALKFMPLY